MSVISQHPVPDVRFVVFLKFLLRQEIIVTHVNNSLSQMSRNVTTLYERSRNNRTNLEREQKR